MVMLRKIQQNGFPANLSAIPAISLMWSHSFEVTPAGFHSSLAASHSLLFKTKP